MTTTYSPPRPVATPARVAGAIAQLAALGVIGPGVFAILMPLLGLGLGLLPVIGIGLLFLLAFVYVLFALSWLENARIDGLYRFGLPARRPRRSPKPGFGGFLHTIWLQFIDPGMWRAVANGASATILGWIVLSLVGFWLSRPGSPRRSVPGLCAPPTSSAPGSNVTSTMACSRGSCRWG